MKKLIIVTLIMTVISFMATARTQVILSVNGNSMTATLVDNEATRELKGLLSQGPVTIQMSDYGGFEKVGALPRSLTTSDSQITAEAGDIMLYQGNSMVIFYGSNSWSYTRLGKIDDANASVIRHFLGGGNISLTLSLDPISDIEETAADVDNEEVIYDMRGNRVTKKPHAPGIYIINGKKTVTMD